jgi:hypothetical protein
LPTEPNYCRRSGWSQIFADGAAAEAELADGANYLPMEPNICQWSQIFSDGAKYLPTELKKKDLQLERNDCRQSRRSQIFAGGAAAEAQFADGANHLPTELQQKANGAAGAKYLPTRICQQSRMSQIFADGAAAGAKFVIGAAGVKFAIFACCMFYCLSIF